MSRNDKVTEKENGKSDKMRFKEIQEKLLNGNSYYNLLEQKDSDLYSRIYNLIESHSEIEDSPQLAEVIGAVSEALAGIQAEALEAGYNKGVADTLQEFKDAGITDLDLTKWDFSDVEIVGIDPAEFDRLIEELDSIEFNTDFKLE